MKSNRLATAAVAVLVVSTALGFNAARVAALPSSESTVTRLTALFGKLSEQERNDWRALSDHCGQGRGEVEAELKADRAAGKNLIRFVCNTEPRFKGQRVYGGGRLWATRWYSDDAFDRSFALVEYDRGLMLFDWAISGTTSKVDFTSGVPYESSESAIELNRKGMVTGRMISTALRDWINASSRRAPTSSP